MILSKIKEQENFITAKSSFQDNPKDIQPYILKVLHCAPSSTQGKMNFYFCAVLMILLYLSSRYSSLEIKLELHRNILKFGYGINYKHEGMLASFF